MGGFELRSSLSAFDPANPHGGRSALWVGGQSPQSRCTHSGAAGTQPGEQSGGALRLPENIAHATDGVDIHRITRIFLDLIADAPDIDIDPIAESIIVV